MSLEQIREEVVEGNKKLYFMQKFAGIQVEDVNVSDPFLFLPEENGIRLPFDVPSEGWNRTSTERFLAYRKEKKITSADELKQILSDREIELLKIHHAFEFLAERKRMNTLSEIFSCLGRKNNWFTWMLSDQEADLLEKTGKKLEIPEKKEKKTAEEGRAEDIPAYFGTYRSKGLYAICGRPAMGKTAFLCSLALEAARKGIPVWFFSFEELHEELMLWMLKIYSKEEQRKTGKGFSEEEYAEIGKRFCKLPISICDSEAQMSELERSIREEVSGGLVILDGLEAIDLKGSVTSPEAVKQQQGRTEEICRRLKELAVERNLAVIVSTGVSREVERRTDHRPKLTDVLGVEKSMSYFDRISAIYREAYYNWKADRSNAELLVLEGTSERKVFSELAYEDNERYFRKAENQK